MRTLKEKRKFLRQRGWTYAVKKGWTKKGLCSSSCDLLHAVYLEKSDKLPENRLDALEFQNRELTSDLAKANLRIRELENELAFGPPDKYGIRKKSLPPKLRMKQGSTCLPGVRMTTPNPSS